MKGLDFLVGARGVFIVNVALLWRMGVRTIEMLPQMTHLQRLDSIQPILVTLRIYLHPVLPPYAKTFQLSACLVCYKAAETGVLIRMLLYRFYY